MHIWKDFVEETPVYAVTRNPDRTSLVIPFTQEALQNAGKKVARVQQSTSQSTQSTSEETLSETAKDILNLIKQNPQITYDEIASSLGKARSGIARHLKRMQKAGIIQPKNENGQWIVLTSE